MGGKLFVSPEATGATLLRGIDLVADGVASTLGPCGRSVILQRSDAGPLVTSSGLRISESIELVRDPFVNQGVQLLREVARENHAEVGDGCTAAMLMSREIVRASLRVVAAGVAPTELRRGIQRAVDEVIDWVRTQARPVAGPSELAAIAGSAARDPEWGALIAEALGVVGAAGVVAVEDHRAHGVSLELRDGMSFDQGLLSPGLAMDPVRGETVMHDPYVLTASERISEIHQLAPILQAVAGERRGLVVIADEISGDALTMLVLNVKKRRIPVVAVKAPMFGADREAALEDIAVLSGGRVYGEGLGTRTRGATLEGLGRFAQVTVTRDRTTMVGGAGDPGQIGTRRRTIEAEIGYLETDYECEKRRRRLARLDGTIAVLRVGCDTNTEQEETRNRLIGGIQTARAALSGGVVSGAGATMVRARAAVAPSAGVDEMARGIVRRALETPLRQAAVNAGLDAAAVISRTEAAPAGCGVDVTTGQVVDLAAAGILDSTEVVCSVLRVAASVGCNCLLASGIVCDKPLPPRRRRSHGHHHGADGGHFGPASASDAAVAHRHEHPHDHAHGHDGHHHDHDESQAREPVGV